MNIKGNYPFAVLHVYRTEGLKKAMKYAASVCKEKMNLSEAREYVDACVKTNGHPGLLDLYL